MIKVVILLSFFLLLQPYLPLLLMLLLTFTLLFQLYLFLLLLLLLLPLLLMWLVVVLTLPQLTILTLPRGCNTSDRGCGKGNGRDVVVS